MKSRHEKQGKALNLKALRNSGLAASLILVFLAISKSYPERSTNRTGFAFLGLLAGAVFVCEAFRASHRYAVQLLGEAVTYVGLMLVLFLGTIVAVVGIGGDSLFDYLDEHSTVGVVGFLVIMAYSAIVPYFVVKKLIDKNAKKLS